MDKRKRDEGPGALPPAKRGPSRHREGYRSEARRIHENYTILCSDNVAPDSEEDALAALMRAAKGERVDCDTLERISWILLQFSFTLSYFSGR